MESLDCKVLIKFHAKDTMVKKCGIHFLYVEDYGEPLETSGGSVDNAKKKGKEKEKNELQCCKLQISNSFDGISSLRPRFMSISKLDIWCLEARYWKLKRNALREIVKTDSLDLGQPFFVKCELFSKGRDHSIIAIGSIQGWFEGDTTHYIKSDHVFLGYDCVMYADQASYLRSGNARCNDESQSSALSTTRDLQSSCFNSFDLNEIPQHSVGSTVNSATIKSSYADSNVVLSNGSTCCDDEPQSCGISTTRDWNSNSFVLPDLNQFPEDSVESMVNVATINKSGCVDDEQQSCGVSTTYDWQFGRFTSLDLNELPQDIVEPTVNVATINRIGYCDDEQKYYGISISCDGTSSRLTTLDLNELPQDFIASMNNVATINEPQPISCFCFMNILVSKLKDFLLRCEDDKEAEGLNPSTSQPTGFAVFDRDDEDELQPKRLKEFKFF
ncbi:hypothetical protein Patl1_21833 [Pistacia atlantica]|uniref:Uncharacterized protein n=1 Tax=Pistacia atlantica TaxID=434234 RepID=A0ACC1BKF6_9ROSI|nr:hypothetical protein Patl1_21833 [Pistacia atlantica]